jgi:V/A-type H+-transporting ATPase subunit E
VLNGIDNIIKKIQSDAALACEDILSKARQSAQYLEEEAVKAAESEAAVLQKKNAAAADAEYNRIVSAGQSEAQKLLLSKKQELINRAFDEAHARLEALNGTEAAELLSRMAAKEAAGAEEIVLPEKLRSQSASIEAGIKNQIAFTGKITFSDAISGGLILRRGGVEWNKTFAALIRQYREELEPAVVSALF